MNKIIAVSSLPNTSPNLSLSNSSLDLRPVYLSLIEAYINTYAAKDRINQLAEAKKDHA